VVSNIHLNQYLNFRFGFSRCRRDTRHRSQIIDTEGDAGAPRQGRNSLQLGRIDDNVRDQDVLDTALDKALRLANRLATDADRPGANLRLCNRRASVCLSVGSKGDARFSS
jgi:hypothetical protein